MDSLSSCNIAIIGANGFVGRALARLISQDTTFCVTLLGRPKFDLVDSATFKRIPDNLDVIIHAAGVVGVGHLDDNLWTVNTIATHSLIAYLNRRQRPPYFLYLSTGGVYGANEGCVDHVLEPRPGNVYSLTKYLAEEIVRKTYSGEFGVARLYFPYGPGQNLDRLIPRLINKIKNDQPITVNRYGRPFISPIYITDLAETLYQMICARIQGVHNVAGKEIITITGIVDIISEILAKKPKLMESETDSLDYCASSIVGMKFVDLKVGLKNTIEAQLGSLC